MKNKLFDDKKHYFYLNMDHGHIFLDSQIFYEGCVKKRIVFFLTWRNNMKYAENRLGFIQSSNPYIPTLLSDGLHIAK